jgi:hypothetical protein
LRHLFRVDEPAMHNSKMQALLPWILPLELGVCQAGVPHLPVQNWLISINILFSIIRFLQNSFIAKVGFKIGRQPNSNSKE